MGPLLASGTDKDSSRPSKQPRTALIKELLQPPKEEKQNGKVRDERIQPTSSGVEPSKGEVRDGSKASAQRIGSQAVPSQPLYSKQEPNGTADDAKPTLVLPPENSSVSDPSSRPGSSNMISNQPTNNFDIAQRQSPELAPVGAMLVLKQPSAWSDVPDEDWLLAGRPPLGSHPKPKADVERGATRRGEPSLQVWAEAVFLPSCDLYALPYVVPY